MSIELGRLAAVFWILQFVLVGCVNGYSVSDTQKQQRKYDERVGETIPTYMSAEDLYPEERARALAVAAGKGDIHRVDNLVHSGANVNYKGYLDVPPIFWAFRNYGGFNRLLELGADPNARFASMSPMHLAARHPDLKFLRATLSHGGDPNLRVGKLYETPIFKTITVGDVDHSEARKLLIEFGADIDATTEGSYFGQPERRLTPAMFAAELVRWDIVMELLRLGADHTVPDANGKDLYSRAVGVRHRFEPDSRQKVFLEETLNWLSDHRVDH